MLKYICFTIQLTSFVTATAFAFKEATDTSKTTEGTGFMPAEATQPENVVGDIPKLSTEAKLPVDGDVSLCKFSTLGNVWTPLFKNQHIDKPRFKIRNMKNKWRGHD